MDKTHIEELKALAHAAGGEQWEHSEGEDIVFGSSGDGVCICHGNLGHMPDPIYPDQHAAFIAAANPAAILELIEIAEGATSPAPAVVQMTADARDAALLRALIADYRLGYRWRMKNGRQQWQVVDDGDPWGKWGEFREVMNTFLGVKHG